MSTDVRDFWLKLFCASITAGMIGFFIGHANGEMAAGREAYRLACESGGKTVATIDHRPACVTVDP